MKPPAASSLPRLGLGMAALGRPGYINLNRETILGNDRPVELMQKQADVVMDKLFAISDEPWLDCARSYGLSEKFVGEYLRRHKIAPEKVYVSSKWGYTYVADWNVKLAEGEPHEVKDHSTDNFLKQVQETSEYLGEYINLYQIHSATFESGILTDAKTHEALSKCKVERGWAIGLSVSSPQQNAVLQKAMTIQSTTTPNQPLFDSVQCTYNLLEQRPGEALLEAHHKGMDIIIKEGLANGRVLRHPDVLQYAKQLACEPDQLALGFILAQPFQPRVLSGAVTPEQLESNLKAMAISETLRENPSLLEEIANKCVMDSDEYWKERSALAWN
ncbi:Aldo/keto reductase family [Seminavis robusta]|uniref:Aldo/keto reductase family n=1 Tax=Seminavis robusta TaxID=568900 RepID=A0A9N8D805_9STRA|nr:Aldo/keto reductase family [Seminavis robusta]|eukprot:Sro11_g008570.1 Aldo/keto reductase family (331) ;mRNA; f:87269-88463